MKVLGTGRARSGARRCGASRTLSAESSKTAAAATAARDEKNVLVRSRCKKNEQSENESCCCCRCWCWCFFFFFLKLTLPLAAATSWPAACCGGIAAPMLRLTLPPPVLLSCRRYDSSAVFFVFCVSLFFPFFLFPCCRSSSLPPQL